MKIRRLLSLLLGLFCWLSAAQWAIVSATFNDVTHVPVAAPGYARTGDNLSFTLNFAPPTRTELMVVNNTAPTFISGVFSNLAQGQIVTVVFEGTTYSFVANYYGGTGNDLV